MNRVAKILIAYDGSACADAALKDLRRAGLPPAVTAVVVTVADVVPPLPGDRAPDEPFLTPAPKAVRHAQAHTQEAVKETLALAEEAGRRLKADFPGWEVKAEAHGDAPAWAVIKLADRYESDLIVVGSHGHRVAGGRLILGSVSQRVLYEARCSVRVARCSDEGRVGPVRLVVGFDGSPAATAVSAVAARTWPQGGEVRVVTWRETAVAALPDALADRLRAAGLTISGVTGEGDRGHVLLKAAEEWGADAIFVGTRDIHGLKHFLHGSVSSAVAARATCSVEVVRPARGAVDAGG